MRRHFISLAPLGLLLGLSLASCGADRETFRTDPSFTGSGGDVDAASTEQGCSSSATVIERTPVVIELLVDESGSMNDAGKWKAARQALLASFEDMRATAEPATFIGIHFYDTNRSLVPRPLTDPVQYQDLIELVDRPRAKGGGTPTSSALSYGFKVLEDFRSPENAGLSIDETKRVLVLLSDGVPTDDPVSSERIVAQKWSEPPPLGPIRTFSVGIGPFPGKPDVYDPAFMGRLAQAGGTARPGCDPDSGELALACHYQITPGGGDDAMRQALIKAIDEIRALSASCEFHFTVNPTTDLGNVKVTVTDRNGVVTDIPKDPANGWSFDDLADPSKVVLHGASCSAVTGAPSGRVDVVIGCRVPK
jgi:uncharacterized protein YegL